MGKTGRLMIALLAFVLAMFPFETWHPLNAQDPSPAPSGSMMPPENLPRVVGPGVLPDLMSKRNPDFCLVCP